MQPIERLLIWVVLNCIFGFLPAILTGLIFMWSRGNSELIRVEDWMFPVTMMVATTMVDLIVVEIPRIYRAVFWMLLFLFTVIAAWLVMANSMSHLFPDQTQLFDRRRLITTSMYVTLFAFVSTLAIQWNLTHHQQRQAP
jgi:uncharacterized membrane protein